MERGAIRRGRRGGGQWGKRWVWGGRGWRGETGRGQNRGGERGKRRVDFTDGYDEMPGWI